MGTRIITHRGLDPDRPDHPRESSYEAFKNHLERGFGIEFDVRYAKDDRLVVTHDKLSEKAIHDAMDLSDLLNLIQETQSEDAVSAIHLKGSGQEKEALDSFAKDLRGADFSKFFVFDVTVDTARYLKDLLPGIKLCPSVAHPYDIERYNPAVGGTLLSLDEASANCNLFEWVWLDEWDRVDGHAGTKAFYTAETFAIARETGLLIAVVSPELHRTSPALLGGEAHEDAADRDTLTRRLSAILDLQPDAVCTDHPDLVHLLARS